MKDDCITLAHGAGTAASHDLIENVFLKAFGRAGEPPLDSAVLPLNQLGQNVDRLAFSTDSYVVSPITFPGGDIGKLAVCGTVNDLAVSGAVPKYLSAGFILEEGLPIAELEQVVNSMALAAAEAGVAIVAGDTKVVARGQADKLYINTTGVGVIPSHLNLSPQQAKPGDLVLTNGFIGDHGVAVMLQRDNLGLNAQVASDCAPLNGMIQQLLAACPGTRVIRDATRGGVATVLHEIAIASGVNIQLNETDLPIRGQTQAVCELLGMEPLFFANEGLAVFIVPDSLAETALATLRQHPYGAHARSIGRVTETSKGLLYINTRYGSNRMIEPPHGIQLPRIC